MNMPKKKPVLPKHHLDDDDDHVIPPPPPPADRMAQYTVDHDPHSEQDIKQYVETQARGERAKHAEKVKEEIVHRRKYEMWDVTTNKNSWWVITDPTNLYLKKDFPSLDYLLSFHIGLTTRALSQQNKRMGIGDEPTPLHEVFRRLDQADERLESAVEAEDYQAVGVLLRETLLTLIASLRRHVKLPADTTRPQDANFVDWSRLLIGQLCPGRSNKPPRSHINASAKDTWDLVGWLVHARNADNTAATVTFHAVNTLVGYFAWLTLREKVDGTDKCPTCGSRDIRTHFDVELEPEGEFETCGACGWSSHPDHP